MFCHKKSESNPSLLNILFAVDLEKWQNETIIMSNSAKCT